MQGITPGTRPGAKIRMRNFTNKMEEHKQVYQGNPGLPVFTGSSCPILLQPVRTVRADAVGNKKYVSQ